MRPRCRLDPIVGVRASGRDRSGHEVAGTRTLQEKSLMKAG